MFQGAVADWDVVDVAVAANALVVADRFVGNRHSPVEILAAAQMDYRDGLWDPEQRVRRQP